MWSSAWTSLSRSLRWGDRGHRRRVGGVGLAGAARAEQAGARGELGGHVQDLLVRGSEQLSDSAAQAGSAFDRPLPLLPALCPSQQQRAHVLGDRQADLPELAASRVQGDRGE